MFHVKLAGYVFMVDNRFPYVERLCQSYLTEEEGELVTISKEEIARENTKEGSWSKGYLESLAVYRKICEKLLQYNILLFHCSALAIEGKAYLFTAPSGTGKSTHTRLWREYFGNQVIMVNDDKPLLRFEKNQVLVFGTPYGGKEGLQTNVSVPVAGIVILHQNEKNVIRRLSLSEAYPMLLNQTYRRQDAEGMVQTMQLVERLAALPVYSMGCTISKEAVEMAYQTLTGKEIEK